MKRVLIIILSLVAISGSLIACSSEQPIEDISQSSLSSSQEESSEVQSAESKSSEAQLAEPKESSKAPKASEPEGAEEIEIPAPSSSTAESSSVPNQTAADKPNEPQNTVVNGTQPIAPWSYQALLGKGMDVDWSKTNQGRKYYNTQAAVDFAAAGVSHVRIRIADKISEELLEGLDRQIRDCLDNGIIPIIAYQADEFKNDPTGKNIKKVVAWWTEVAERYQDVSHLLSFDLLIEATDSLNKQPEKLNEIYEQLVTEIRKTNPTRIIMISPRLRSDAAYLQELKIPTQHNGYLMAEWHFYAAGPSKTNERKLWTSGTEQERALIDEKIALALVWQEQTGVPTWVGAWMPGNYNDGNDYSIEEQVQFAGFMTEQLTSAGIPFAVNSDTKFYDRENNRWITDMQPIFNIIYK